MVMALSCMLTALGLNGNGDKLNANGVSLDDDGVKPNN
jgi:hypothetical protein